MGYVCHVIHVTTAVSFRFATPTGLTAEINKVSVTHDCSTWSYEINTSVMKLNDVVL